MDLLRDGGAPLGDVYAFVSSLYFRGKRAYAETFARPPEGTSGVLVITPSLGLVPLDHPVSLEGLGRMARVPIDPLEPRYRRPLAESALRLAEALGPSGEAVLLGSLATDKYLGPLGEVLGDRLRIPEAFVGRGDMSRGGLMLRAADAREELTYRVLSSPRRLRLRRARRRPARR